MKSVMYPAMIQPFDARILLSGLASMFTKRLVSRGLDASVTVTCVVIGVVACQGVLAQSLMESRWQGHAERRLRAIYDQGDFRGKAVSATWLSDSSGFVVDEVDPHTSKVVAAFYEANTGERRPAQTNPETIDASHERGDSHANLQVESRGNKLFSVNRKTGDEFSIVAGEPGRKVEYRNPSFSPDHARVLFVEADYTDVRQRSVLLPGDPSYPEVHQHRFARVGDEIERIRIGVVQADGSGLIWLPVDCPEEGMYLGQVEWAGNSDQVLVEKFSRFRDSREFLLVSTSGSSQVIFSESSETWVESSQGKNSGLVWIKGGAEFIVISEKDGWRHAYRYSREGKELARLTEGDYDIIDRAAIDEEKGWYYFYASPDDATQKYLYRVPLVGLGAKQRVSPGGQVGTHSYLFSPDMDWAVHTYSSFDDPPIQQLIEVDSHRVVRVLEENQGIRDRMKSLNCQPVEFLKLDIGDQIVLDAWMLKPKDIDPAKKYPLLVYVYGEPHAQTVLDEWGAAQADFHRLVAELGYIVVSIDNRGTPAPKGADWRRAIFGSLGPLSTDEQEAGLQSLAKQCPFVDTSRVGIWGWSGGGSNTLNAMFRNPESYQVGIAVVPKPQPHLYNAWFQEIYMRDRIVNPDGYKRSAPINYAAGLDGKLLIMTGSGETNTHIEIIEGLVDRLIELGKPFDYMVYPNRDHGLREGLGTVVHVRMRILRFLVDNLPAGPTRKLLK